MLQRLFHRKFVRDTLILQVGNIGITGMTFLSSLLLVRLMGTEAYGAWSLVQSFLSIWQSLNLTGVSISTPLQLGVAVGAKDSPEILNLLAVYIQISIVWSIFLTVSVALLGPLLAARLYGGETQIGVLAFWLSLASLPDALYSLVVLALHSQRSMRTVAILTNMNQFVLLLCTVVALAISPTPESMVVARLVYSGSTLLMALEFYRRTRTQHAVPYPPLHEIITHVGRVSPRPYMRFGALNAIDKNVASLYTDLPLQMVGILAGKAAAGYLQLGFKALTIPGVLTSAVFDNLQAVIPQAVGRRDFKTLWRNFNRVLVSLALGSVAFYIVFALVAPILIPLLYGLIWRPAVPIVVILSIFGAVTMTGGILGPLYRTLNLMRSAILIKAVTLIVVLLAGWFVLHSVSSFQDTWTFGGLFPIVLPELQAFSSVIGAWMVNGLYILSIGLTAVVTLPVLREKARQAT